MADNSFYHWEIDDETNFRKLIIHEFKTEFETERDKFNNWNGLYKTCTKCKRKLPKSDYFFRFIDKDKLFSRCKECEGKKFSWGRKKQQEFVAQNQYYCAKCDTVYPLNDIYFVKNKYSSTGYHRNCKKCSVHSPNFGINRNINLIVDVKEGFQVCLNCFLELPKTQIYYCKQNKNKDDFETMCKKCRGGQYGIKSLNVINKMKDYRYCTSCERLLPEDEFFIKNKKKNKRYSICKECKYIYEAKRRKSYYNSNYTYEDWEFAKKFWTDENGEIHCAYCNEIVLNPAMEHIIPFAKGGEFTKNNIIPACKSCNSQKGTKSLDEFYQSSDKFNEELYNKIQEYIALTSK